MAPVACRVCSRVFEPRKSTQRYCSRYCREQWRRVTVKTTEHQYRGISGDWRRYFGRLCATKDRRKYITPQDCLDILEKQQGRCALSGEILTCRLERGKPNPTNASLDRKNPGGTYAPENVQLVCSVLNSFRSSTPLDEFIGWCRKVAAYGEEAS